MLLETSSQDGNDCIILLNLENTPKNGHFFQLRLVNCSIFDPFFKTGIIPTRRFWDPWTYEVLHNQLLRAGTLMLGDLDIPNETLIVMKAPEIW